MPTNNALNVDMTGSEAEPVGQRERAKRDRRHRILAVAASLIEQGSLETATIRAVAAGADVSPATIYNLIGSQNDLFDALHNELIANVSKRLREINASPIEWILQTSTVTVECLSERRALFGPLLAQRRVAVTHEYGPLRRRIVAGLRQQLDRGIDVGQIQAGTDTKIVAEILHSSFLDNQVRWALGEFDTTMFDQRSHRYAHAILRGAVTAEGQELLSTMPPESPRRPR